MKRFVPLMICVTMCLSLFSTTSAAYDKSTGITKEEILAALYEADIETMRQALELGLVSCGELTAYYLERIEAFNATYNCFITICDDALEVARERDEQLAAGTAKGILFGIPVVIKDNIDLAGYHTTNGHKKNDSQIAESNADVVDYLLSEGAVIIGKTNMSTDAQEARRSVSQAVGETKNAYNPYLASGGSSGGSAVAVALNFAAAALGTDTNSSLRIPAALNGCVSLRTTFGLISRTGVVRLNSSRDTVGAITRTVYDQAVMLDVLTGGAYSFTENLDANALEGMRIGVLAELSYAVAGSSIRKDAYIDDEIAAAFENALAELEACGAEIVTVSVHNLFTLSIIPLATATARIKRRCIRRSWRRWKRMTSARWSFPPIFPLLPIPARTKTGWSGTHMPSFLSTTVIFCPPAPASRK